MNEIQTIINVTLPFVKSLLKDYGEFYPMASASNHKGEVVQVLLEEVDDENDFPKSNSVIGELKKELHSKRTEFVAIAIFYDVKLKESQTDAIAILVEHKEEKQAYTFYYPYKIVDNTLEFADSWKVIENMEILIED
jgi:hypothetical protein